MKLHPWYKLILGIVFVVSLPGIVHAQMSGGMGGPGGGMGNRAEGGRGGGAQKKSVSPESFAQEQMQQRFAELEDKLKLRPEQGKSWEIYQDKVSALSADLARTKQTAGSAKDTALQQIERKLDVVRNRLTALEEIADSAQKLYLQLDPKQKLVADQLLANTVPALYSGFWQQQMNGGEKRPEGDKEGRGKPDGNGPPGR